MTPVNGVLMRVRTIMGLIYFFDGSNVNTAVFFDYVFCFVIFVRLRLIIIG